MCSRDNVSLRARGSVGRDGHGRFHLPHNAVDRGVQTEGFLDDLRVQLELVEAFVRQRLVA